MSKNIKKNTKNNSQTVGSSSIKYYFKKQEPTVENDLVVAENTSSTIPTYSKPISDFYNKCQLKSLESENCTERLCVDEKQQLKTKIQETKKTIDQILKAQQFAADIIKEKDEKILRLRTQIDSHNNQPSTSSQKATVNIESATVNVAPLNAYDNFSEWFSAEQLSMLRGIEKALSGDSTFILAVMRSLFEKNIDELKNITVAGQHRKNSMKKKIDEMTLKVITDIFNERINGVDEAAKSNRKKRLNKLLNSAITNINNANKNKHEDNSELQPMLIEKEKQ